MTVGVLAVFLRGLAGCVAPSVAAGTSFLVYKVVLGETYLQNRGQSQHLRGRFTEHFDLDNEICGFCYFSCFSLF